jgi:NAD(P)-dependent dehydrogenase (short-subunit alcohol dehydrogenase family)
MHLDLSGRVALITGGSKGIGKAIGKAFSDAGASVMMVSRRQANLDEAVLDFPPDRVATYAAHAGDHASANGAVQATVERFGGLDILVNNAATNPHAGRLTDIDLAKAEKTALVNMYAPVMWSRLAWDSWMETHGGAIINIATIGAFLVSPGIGYYDATKAALLSLNRHLAWEMAPNVRVNAICPGVVRTDMARALWEEHERELASTTLIGRLGEPEDIAGMALFLASDAASWITASAFVVDGGTMAAPLAATHMEPERERSGL